VVTFEILGGLALNGDWPKWYDLVICPIVNFTVHPGHQIWARPDWATTCTGQKCILPSKLRKKGSMMTEVPIRPFNSPNLFGSKSDEADLRAEPFQKYDTSA
jgi:hypothetical protein